MKKLTVEECEYLNISTITYYLKYNGHSSQRSIADELARLSQKSLSNEFAGVPRFRLLFTTTRCHFGGVRYWFLCPSCRKRIGKLYTPLSGREFKCRHCYNLTYESSQVHNQRVTALAKQLKEIHKKDGKEALIQVAQKVQRTRRGRKLLVKVSDKLTPPRPAPFLARKEKEREGYEKYIRLLYEV